MFDWQQVLKKGLLQKAVDLWEDTIRRGSKLFFLDQDALNLAFHGNWQPLPVSMNASSIMFDYFQTDTILRHFSAHYKPWAKYWMPGLKADKETYRALLSNSPWPEFQIEDFSTIDYKELLGRSIRRIDFITRARYRRHVRQGL